MIEPRILLLVLAGLGLWGTVALEKLLERLPVSLPMLYVAIGWAVFQLPLGLPTLDPMGDAGHTLAAELLTEFIVIVSLMAAGLAIDRPFSWSNWRQIWPLLGITMPLTLLAVALIGWAWLGLAPAAALLLAAALAPTDPVLADGVQVGPPGDSERNDVRFGLTVEAGLNDCLAFPFTYLALAAVGVSGLGGWTWEWLARDVGWRIVVGVAVGIAVGRAGAWWVFRHSDEPEAAERDEDHDDPGLTPRSNEGLVVMATLLVAYGLAEIAEGYGFLAVFAGAVTARQCEPGNEYHARTHQFVDQLEDIVLVAMLFGFGGLLASGVLAPLTWPAAALAAGLVLVIRPVAGLVAQIGCKLPWPGRLAVAFCGVRGMASLYYLSYAQLRGQFAGIDLLWATASLVILLSVVVHGIAAQPLMRWLERHDLDVVPGEAEDVTEVRTAETTGTAQPTAT
jgi:NhaP-type Na+/H+ or K+/H+ antiporter